MDDKNEKKEGFGRKHLNPVRDAKNIAMHSHKQARQDMEFTKRAGSEFMRRLKYMFVTRKQKTEKVDLTDFQDLLRFWGIHEADLHKVKKNMRVSNCAVFLMIIMATLGIHQATDLYFYCLLSGLIVGGLMKSVVTYWQLWVLKRRQYVSFKDWFTLNF